MVYANLVKIYYLLAYIIVKKLLFQNLVISLSLFLEGGRTDVWYGYVVTVQSLVMSSFLWPHECQSSLSINISLRLPKLMFTESVMPSSLPILCCPFSYCPQFSPASESFPVSQLFSSGGQIIGASASASVLPVNIQDWYPLGLTDLISLHTKVFSRVFSSTTVQKHWFFGSQLSLLSSCHINTWLLEKP